MKYLENKPGSMLQFFALKWELKNKELGDIIAPRSEAGPFSVMHSITDGWWEVGYDNNEGVLTVDRFYSMEECVAYIVCRWW